MHVLAPMDLMNLQFVGVVIRACCAVHVLGQVWPIVAPVQAHRRILGQPLCKDQRLRVGGAGTVKAVSFPMKTWVHQAGFGPLADLGAGRGIGRETDPEALGAGDDKMELSIEISVKSLQALMLVMRWSLALCRDAVVQQVVVTRALGRMR